MPTTVEGVLATVAVAALLVAAGCGRPAADDASPPSEARLSLRSPAFEMRGRIPTEHTCDGSNTSPALHWNGPPAGTAGFALIVDDPDAPGGTFTHWTVAGIPATAQGLPAAVPRAGRLNDPPGAVQGAGDFQRIGYGGPCPPPGETHRYFFRLYALDVELGLEPGFSRQELQRAMAGHILADAELMGRYARR